jgi:hypothetical protein
MSGQRSGVGELAPNALIRLALEWPHRSAAAGRTVNRGLFQDVHGTGDDESDGGQRDGGLGGHKHLGPA